MTNIHALIVEDEVDSAEVVERILTYHNISFVTTHNAEDALLTLQTEAPTVLIIDLALPGMDGWVVTKHLVRRGGANPPRIVMISASFAREEVHPEGGAVIASLPKPIDLKRLREVVERAWASEVRPSRLPAASPESASAIQPPRDRPGPALRGASTKPASPQKPPKR